MTAFYKQAFVLPFCKHYQQTGDWKTALTLLALNGLVEGENRFPITFAERTAKIARMRNWTVSDQYPNGDEKMTEAIIDFWTYDLEELSVHLHQQKHAQLPELIERPLLKIDQYLFQLPWLIAQQNNVTAAVNNLRRFGKNRQEQKTETHRIEQRLAILFKSCGFHVFGNFQPARDSSEVGEIDLICYQSDHLFIFEIKSGYIRKTPRDAWQHRTNTLRKAGLQLKRKSEWVVKSLETDATLANLISENSSSDKLKIHSWIIDTSIEHDHEYFSNFLKVSLQEVQMALLNKRHFLRDIEEKIFSTIRHRRPDNEDIIDQIETIIANFSKQKPIDNLYPQGFSAERFAEIIEMGMMWEEL